MWKSTIADKKIEANFLNTQKRDVQNILKTQNNNKKQMQNTLKQFSVANANNNQNNMKNEKTKINSNISFEGTKNVKEETNPNNSCENNLSIDANGKETILKKECTLLNKYILKKEETNCEEAYSYVEMPTLPHMVSHFNSYSDPIAVGCLIPEDVRPPSKAAADGVSKAYLPYHLAGSPFFQPSTGQNFMSHNNPVFAGFGPSENMLGIPNYFVPTKDASKTKMKTTIVENSRRNEFNMIANQIANNMANMEKNNSYFLPISNMIEGYQYNHNIPFNGNMQGPNLARFSQGSHFIPPYVSQNQRYHSMYKNNSYSYNHALEQETGYPKCQYPVYPNNMAHKQDQELIYGHQPEVVMQKPNNNEELKKNHIQPEGLPVKDSTQPQSSRNSKTVPKREKSIVNAKTVANPRIPRYLDETMEKQVPLSMQETRRPRHLNSTVKKSNSINESATKNERNQKPTVKPIIRGPLSVRSSIVQSGTPMYKHVAIRNDHTDCMLQGWHNSHNSVIPWKRINKNLYYFGDTEVKVDIINGKLMCSVDAGLWNRGKMTAIEKFVAYFEPIERSKYESIDAL